MKKCNIAGMRTSGFVFKTCHFSFLSLQKSAFDDLSNAFFKNLPVGLSLAAAVVPLILLGTVFEEVYPGNSGQCSLPVWQVCDGGLTAAVLLSPFLSVFLSPVSLSLVQASCSREALFVLTSQPLSADLWTTKDLDLTPATQTYMCIHHVFLHLKSWLSMRASTYFTPLCKDPNTDVSFIRKTNSSLAIPLLDVRYSVSFSVKCLFCHYETDKDVCSLLPWDLSCLFIGPTGTATMAPDINQAWRRCSVLSCRIPKMSQIHTLTTRKQNVSGGGYGRGQHSCDKALTVSPFSLQPAHAGSCWNKYQLTPLGREPNTGRRHKNSKQVKTAAAVPVTCW